MLKTILILGAGGFIGSNLRYFTGKLVHGIYLGNFPLGTLTVNAAGSFLLGLVFVLAVSDKHISANARLFLGTGLLGAFTTFSTFSWETVELIRKGQAGQAGINIGLNLGVGFVCVLAGIALGEFILKK